MPDQPPGLVQPSNELAVVTTLERKYREVFSDMMHRMCLRLSNLMKTYIPSTCPIYAQLLGRRNKKIIKLHHL